MDQLSPIEKEALALFYETDAYKALDKFCKLDVVGLGRDALVAPSMEQVMYLKGKAYMAEHIPKLIRQLYKEQKN